MKRQNFLVTSDAGHNVVKFAWNSAIRETERLIKDTARREAAVYNLTDSTSVKDGFGFVAGSRVWTRTDGRVVNFKVVRS